MNSLILELGFALAVVTLVGGGTGLAAWLLMRANRNPHWRYAICLGAQALFPLVFALAMAKFEAPVEPAKPLLTVTQAEVSRPEPRPVPQMAPIAQVPSQPPVEAFLEERRERISWMDLLASGSPWMVGGWILGMAVCASRLLSGWVVLRKLRGSARVLECPALGRCAERLGLRTSVQLLESARALGPLTIGWLRPVIIVPIGWMARLSQEQTEAVLLHELSHIRRFDYLVNWLQSALEAVFFFHPVIWWLGREARSAREECCDAAVIAAGMDRAAYARLLADLHAFGPQLALAAGGGNLRSRILRLLRPQPQTVNPAGLVGILAIFTVLILVGLPSPSRGQELKSRKIEPPLAGTVQDAAGNPLAGAMVVLYHRGHELDFTNGVTETVTTNASGQYQFASPLEYRDAAVDGWSDLYYVLATHPQWAPNWVQLNALPGPGGRDRLNLQLADPVSRTAVVKAANGQPVAGARIWLSRIKTIHLNSDAGILGGVTDAQGRLTLPNLPKLPMTLRAEKEGFTHAYRNRDAAKEGDWEFTLKPAARYTGRAMDGNNRPLPGVSVLVKTRGSGDSWFQRTDAEGRFQFNALYGDGDSPWKGGDGGNYEVTFRHPDYLAPARKMVLASGQTQDAGAIQFKPATTLEAVLMEGREAKPVSGAQVYCRTNTGEQQKITDAEGKVTFQALRGSEAQIYLKNPPLGTYFTDQIGRNYPTWNGQVTDRNAPVRIFVEDGLGQLKPLQARLRFPDGQPREAFVYWIMRDDIMCTFKGYSTSEYRITVGPDEEKFIFPDVPANHPLILYACTTSLQFAGLVRLDSFRNNVEIPMQPTGSRTVNFVDLDGKPVQNTQFHIQMQEGSRHALVRHFNLSSGKEGSATPAGLLPGVTYRILQTDEPSIHQDAVLFGKGVSTEPFIFTVSPDLVLQLKNRDGQMLPIQEILSGEVRTATATWKPGKSLQVNGKRPDGSVTVPRSSLHLDETGEFVGRVKLANGRTGIARGRVPLADAVTLPLSFTAEDFKLDGLAPSTITPEKEDQLAGRILDETGRPYAGATVGVEEVKMVTGADGVYRIQPRRWVLYLQVDAPGYATRWIPKHLLEKPLDITLHRNTRIAGTIQRPDGHPPGVVKLILENFRATPPDQDQMERKLGPLRLDLTTDSAGKYDALVEPGTYRVRATAADDLVLWDEAFEIAAGETKALPALLRPGLTLEMLFQDADTGQPVPDYTLYFNEMMNPIFMQQIPGSKKTSGADGRIRWSALHPTGIWAASPNREPRGTRQQSPFVSWWLDGKKPTVEHLQFSITETGPREVRVNLRKGMRVSGQVRRPVDITGELPRLEVAAHTMVPGQGFYGWFNVPCDDEGKFDAWVPVPDSPIILCAFEGCNGWDRQYAMGVSERFQPQRGAEFTFDLRLEHGGGLRGKIANPRKGLSVHLSPEGGIPEPSGGLWVAVKEDGTFLYPAIRPGNYGVYLRDGGHLVDVVEKPVVEVKQGEVADLGILTLRAEN